jgi:hypothetical protein
LKVAGERESVSVRDSRRGGEDAARNRNQGQHFYEFHLDDAVPDGHLVRKIGAVPDLSWVRAEVAPYCSELDRPSIDPVLMIRMLIIG